MRHFKVGDKVRVLDSYWSSFNDEVTFNHVFGEGRWVAGYSANNDGCIGIVTSIIKHPKNEDVLLYAIENNVLQILMTASGLDLAEYDKLMCTPDSISTRYTFTTTCPTCRFSQEYKLGEEELGDGFTIRCYGCNREYNVNHKGLV